MYSAYGGRVGAAIGSILYFIAIVISKLSSSKTSNSKRQISLFYLDSSLLRLDWSWWTTERRMVFDRDLALHVGLFGRRLRGLPFRGWRRFGHLHDWHLHCRRRCQSSPDQNQELDFCYFLRGRGYLWTHHRYCALRTNWTVQGIITDFSNVKKSREFKVFLFLNVMLQFDELFSMNKVSIFLNSMPCYLTNYFPWKISSNQWNVF